MYRPIPSFALFVSFVVRFHDVRCLADGRGYHLVIAGGSALLGLLASIPARIPRTGIPIFWCCVVIGGVAIVVRAATEPSIPKMSPLSADEIAALKTMSYAATLMSAVIASAVLTALAPLYGRWCDAGNHV